MSDERAPALFGKLPSRGDFVRAGRADESSRFVESWLTAGVEHSRGELAAEPVRCLFSHAGEVLLGCWVPSRDAVGRQFPFACFGRLPCDLAELGWSLLLGLHEAFLGAAEALLRSACTASAPALAALQAELAALERPHASELVRALHDAQARLTAESVASFERRAFGALETLPYALWTLREAARRGNAELTLDVPAASAFDLFVWLELAGCFEEGGRHFPALIWCPQQARALLARGAPSTSALAFLVDRRHVASSRWPLWTERPAGAQAISELSPAVREVLAARGSLTDLVAALRG